MHSGRPSIRNLPSLLAACLAAVACGGGSPSQPTCQSGAERACGCPDGSTSIQSCLDNEPTWAPCDCGASTGGSGGGTNSGGDGGAVPLSGGTGAVISTGDTGGIVEEPLVPHAVGNRWTYRFVQVDTTEPIVCEEGVFTSTFTSMQLVNGVETYTYVSACSQSGVQHEVQIQFEGDRQVSLTTGDVLVDTPIEDGYAWSSPAGASYHWERAGTTAVAAGTFDDCWVRVRDDFEDRATHCRGVGRVSGESGYGYTTELISYQVQ